MRNNQTNEVIKRRRLPIPTAWRFVQTVSEPQSCRCTAISKCWSSVSLEISCLRHARTRPTNAIIYRSLGGRPESPQTQLNNDFYDFVVCVPPPALQSGLRDFAILVGGYFNFRPSGLLCILVIRP